MPPKTAVTARFPVISYWLTIGYASSVCEGEDRRQKQCGESNDRSSKTATAAAPTTNGRPKLTSPNSAALPGSAANCRRSSSSPTVKEVDQSDLAQQHDRVAVSDESRPAGPEDRPQQDDSDDP